MFADTDSTLLRQNHVPENPAVNQRLLASRGEYLGYLRRRLGTLEEAEDVLHDFSLKAVRAARSLSHDEKINAWLGQILRHTLVDHYRRRAVRQRAETAFSQEMHIAETTTEDDPDTGPCQCLHAAVQRLRPEFEEILRRADLEEQPRARVAADLRLTANALNVRLHRARQALRLELERSCPACRTGSYWECACG